MPPPPAAKGPATIAKALRQLSIVQFPFAFILLFAHGVAVGSPFPSLAIMPLTASALLSAFILSPSELTISGNPIFLSPSNIIAIDVALIVIHLTVLIPSWIMLTLRRSSTSTVILGTYGTVFQMLDIGVHAHFALKELWHMCTAHICDCPHCQSVRSTKRSSLLPANDEYTPLTSEEPRISDELDLEAGN